eukprot:768082-Hanusia_phi.AAC.3
MYWIQPGAGDIAVAVCNENLLNYLPAPYAGAGFPFTSLFDRTFLTDLIKALPAHGSFFASIVFTALFQISISLTIPSRFGNPPPLSDDCTSQSSLSPSSTPLPYHCISFHQNIHVSAHFLTPFSYHFTHHSPHSSPRPPLPSPPLRPPTSPSPRHPSRPSLFKSVPHPLTDLVADPPQTAKMLVVGVDGGATKTEATVMDGEGEEVDRAAERQDRTELAMREDRQDDANVGKEQAANSLVIAVENSLKESKADIKDAQCIVLGMSGCDTPADVEFWLSVCASKFPSCKAMVENDSVIALCSGTGGKMEGVVVISGTGSIGLGVAGGGAQRVRVGESPTPLTAP